MIRSRRCLIPRRAPLFAFEFEEALDAFALTRPTYAFALFPERSTARLGILYLCTKVANLIEIQKNNFTICKKGRGSSDILSLSLCRLSIFRLFVHDYDFAPEGETRAVARVRDRRSVGRTRKNETDIRVRAVPGAKHSTTFIA